MKLADMKLADVKLAEKTIGQDTFGAVSRRTILTGGLAGGFLLAFHLPLGALTPNEPLQPPDDTHGKVPAQAFIRIDQAGPTTPGMAAGRAGPGMLYGRA